MRRFFGLPSFARILLSIVLAGLATASGYWFGTHRSAAESKQRQVLTGQGAWNDLDFGGQKYPVLYKGDYISLGEEVRNLGSFLPAFSPDRAEVNPGKPRIDSNGPRTRLYFNEPGEYYLDINNQKKLKVLVLNQQQEISSNVLRLFDFLVANLVVTQGNDEQFYQDSGNFTMDFFKTKDPKMLLCGPTLAFFEILLRDRFHLPVRDVTLTGVFMEGGQVRYSTHNVIEVFLPDKHKWMMFDVNNGLAIKWLDSFEITEKVREAALKKVTITKTEFDSIPFDFHYRVDAKRSVNAADLREVFYPGIVSHESVREHWDELGRVYLGGPAYWGGERFGRKGLPPKYQLYVSRYHEDPFLLSAQLKWQGNWDLKTRHFSPSDLQAMLNQAYADEIASKKWLAYLPRPADSTALRR